MKPATPSTSAVVKPSTYGLIFAAAMRKFCFSPANWVFLALIAIVPCALAGTVTITSPVNGSMNNSSVHVHATYTGGTGTATYMKMWIDHNPSTVQKNTNVFDTTTSLASIGEEKVKQIGDSGLAIYLNAGPSKRKIMDRAVDF